MKKPQVYTVVIPLGVLPFVNGTHYSCGSYESSLRRKAETRRIIIDDLDEGRWIRRLRVYGVHIVVDEMSQQNI